jgi:hypothetical protein
MEAFWDRIRFWNKKKTPKYKFENFEDAVTVIEITSGKYSGVVYTYGRVKFSDEFGMPKLSFGYNIIHPGTHTLDQLQDDQEYVTIMGDILTELIIKNESSRKNYSEESDLQ